MLITLVAIAAAVVLLLPQRPAVTEAQPAAQLPPGPRTVHQSSMEIASPPATLDAVQTVLDFAPGAWTPPHSHGGDVLITVLAGTMTVRGHDGERTYATGETWIERPGDVHAAGNAGSTRLIASRCSSTSPPAPGRRPTGTADRCS
jgi:quercetin dioxygenase-like cupin family protein